MSNTTFSYGVTQLDGGEARQGTRRERQKVIAPLSVSDIAILSDSRARRLKMGDIQEKLQLAAYRKGAIETTDTLPTTMSMRRAEEHRQLGREKQLFNYRSARPEYGEDRPLVAVVEPRRWTR